MQTLRTSLTRRRIKWWLWEWAIVYSRPWSRSAHFNQNIFACSFTVARCCCRVSLNGKDTHAMFRVTWLLTSHSSQNLHDRFSPVLLNVHEKGQKNVVIFLDAEQPF